jgi:hypothetical protein
MGPSGIVDYEATTHPGDAQGRGAIGALFVGGSSVARIVAFNESTYDKETASVIAPVRSSAASHSVAAGNASPMSRCRRPAT